MTAFGSVIKGVDDTFVGDCTTTNDILGPFYRPNAPIRSDLTFEGQIGTKVKLKGRIFKSDCVTPLKKAMVEIWHCDVEGKYDNDSKNFKQRVGSQV